MVIMEADLSMDQRHWYLRAVLQFGWSKAELLRQISDSVHEKMNLDVSTGTCYTDIDKAKQERQNDEDSFCVSRQDFPDIRKACKSSISHALSAVLPTIYQCF